MGALQLGVAVEGPRDVLFNVFRRRMRRHGDLVADPANARQTPQRLLGLVTLTSPLDVSGQRNPAVLDAHMDRRGLGKRVPTEDVGGARRASVRRGGAGGGRAD